MRTNWKNPASVHMWKDFKLFQKFYSHWRILVCSSSEEYSQRNPIDSAIASSYGLSCLLKSFPFNAAWAWGEALSRRKYTIDDYRREAKCCGGLGAGNQRDLDNGVRGNSFQVKSEPFEEHRQKLLSVIFESVYNSSNGKFKSTFPAEAMTNGGHPPRTDAHWW